MNKFKKYITTTLLALTLSSSALHAAYNNPNVEVMEKAGKVAYDFSKAAAGLFGLGGAATTIFRGKATILARQQNKRVMFPVGVAMTTGLALTSAGLLYYSLRK